MYTIYIMLKDDATLVISKKQIKRDSNLQPYFAFFGTTNYQIQ